MNNYKENICTAISFFFSSRRRHTRFSRAWSSDVCSSDLAPARGLPPELPGSFAADLAARQLWWAFAAGSAALGLGLLVFGRKTVLKVLGVIVALVPSIVGAPSPESVGGSVPPELASQFAATSIVVSAIFWTLLGWLSAVFYQRFDETA